VSEMGSLNMTAKCSPSTIAIDRLMVEDVAIF
jgi:hypothetical protein